MTAMFFLKTQSDGAKCLSLCNGTIRWQCPVRLLCNKFIEHHFDCFHLREYKKIASSQPPPPLPCHIPFQYCNIKVEKVTCGGYKVSWLLRKGCRTGEQRKQKFWKESLFDVFVLFCFFIDIYGLTPKFNKHLNMIKSVNMYFCAPSSTL